MHLPTYCTPSCGLWNTKLHKFLGNLIKLSICPIRSFFGKNDCFFLLTFCVLFCLLAFQIRYSRLQYFGLNWVQIVHLPHKRFWSCYNILKKPLKSKSWGRRLQNSGPNWVWVTPPKGYFLEKLTIGLTTVFNHATSFQKNHHGAIKRIRLPNFFPNCP